MMKGRQAGGTLRRVLQNSHKIAIDESSRVCGALFSIPNNFVSQRLFLQFAFPSFQVNLLAIRVVGLIRENR